MNIFYADIIKIFVEEGQRTGKICVNGVFKNISLTMLPDAKEGERVLIRDGVPVIKPLSDKKENTHIFSDTMKSARSNDADALKMEEL